MRRKVLSVMMVSALAISMVACGGKEQKKTYNVEELSTIATTEGEVATEKEIAYGEGNILTNGDFENGTGSWTTYKNGGDFEMYVNDDKELQCDITNIGAVEHGVQIYYDGFAIRQGGVYEISFDIHGTLERALDWRIQVNGGDYHAYVMDTVVPTAEVQHVTAEFTMEEETDPAPRLVFNMGLVDTLASEGVTTLEPHSVMIDNISLVVVDATNMIKDPDPVPVARVKVNQVGYKANANKVAICSDLDDADNKFMLVNAETDEVVYTGNISEKQIDIGSDEWISYADFSEYVEPGTYKVRTIGNAESHTFTIGDDVYDKTFDEVVKMLYMQRCGCELTAEHAGDFAHPVCHNTEAVIFGTSTKIDVSGGWHDAGDYGRYVAPGAKTVADLLLAYEKNPKAFSDDLGIPESGNGISDVLDEARYELEWMFKMQDPATGAVYHKVTCEVFPETVMPQDETDELIVSPISGCATGGFAGAMAMAARVYADVDKDFADKCLAAAKKAYEYMRTAEHDPGFKNPGDVVTGEYRDYFDQDERFWAGAELFKTTKDAAYEADLKNWVDETKFQGLGWADMGGYAAYAYLTAENQDETLKTTVTEQFNKCVEDLLAKIEKSAYLNANGLDYIWGSNLETANAGMYFLFANDISPNADYVKIAMDQLNYLYGANSTGYCFVTGAGTVSPISTHHRPSQVLEKTMPGMLVGGPNANLEDPYAKAVLLNTPYAKCYVDNSQCFSCNEITIYWNSPLIYLLANAQ